MSFGPGGEDDEPMEEAEDEIEEIQQVVPEQNQAQEYEEEEDFDLNALVGETPPNDLKMLKSELK